MEIWSDVVCPWCYIGKRRFEAALEAFEHADEVTVMWRSFELDQEAPKVVEGTATERLAAKYGMSLERASQLHAEMTERAAAEGLEFRFDLARGGNTFDAHRLIHLAATYGHQAAAKERLMRAYFTEGEAIADPETLVRVLAEVGVDADEARDVLADRPLRRRRARGRAAGVAARHPGRAVLRARPPLRRVRRAAARGARPGAAAGVGEAVSLSA